MHEDSGNPDLIKKIELVKLRQQEINAEEVQAILDQRDAALAKVMNEYCTKTCLVP